jgi:hypothetical protein
MKFLYNATILPTTRTPDEALMTARLLRYWGGFMHNGDPDHFGLTWPRFDQSGQVIRFQPANDVLASGEIVPSATAAHSGRASGSDQRPQGEQSPPPSSVGLHVYGSVPPSGVFGHMHPTGCSQASL